MSELDVVLVTSLPQVRVVEDDHHGDEEGWVEEVSQG